MRLALGTVIALAGWASIGHAQGQTVTVRAESRELYVGLPFALSVEAQGFEETPEPKVAPFEIPGARVTFVGVSPNVSSMISIVNGHRTERREVSFVFRYRVEVPAPGNYQVPAITVEQGTHKAQSRPASFRARDVEATSDMQIRLGLPTRPIWVGETFDVVLDWYLRRDVSDQQFSVPLFSASGIEVQAKGEGGRGLRFSAGSKDLELPYERSEETLDGVATTRLRFTAQVTALAPGTFELPPARVVAQLQVGQGRDAFGFPVPRVKLFKAEDQARTLEIRAVPASGRPKSFANAVGSSFSLEVQADRTVVSVGDPVELRVLVRGNGRLEGLMLPDLASDGGLAPERFGLPDEAPAGEILDSGQGKLFRVTVRVKSPDVREIPPLSFSYFDPEVGEYRTARSQAIALQVKGSAMVGAADVVKRERSQAAAAAVSGGEKAPAPVSLVGADLTLSRERETLRPVLSVRGVRPVLVGLYALPVLILGAQLWRLKTRGRRAVSSEIAKAKKAVDAELGLAAREAAREVAPRLVRALRQLAQKLDLEENCDGGLFERLETEAFDPTASGRPLSDDLRLKAADLASQWMERPRRGASAPAVMTLVLVILGLGAGGALAEAPSDGAEKLKAARDQYQMALSAQDRDVRTRGFAQAEGRFRDLVKVFPDRPELLSDWGNAALGAQELGWATLAYRRALALYPGQARARRNLSWVRKQAPDWVPKPHDGGVVESLFFWHNLLSAAKRHLIAGGAFGLAVLLMVPFAGTLGRRRLLRRFAALPVIVWLAMVTSLVMSRDVSADAVVVGDAVTLRSADSLGAPAVVGQPLPQGTEGELVETRDVWARFRLANGTTGWIERSWVEKVSVE